MRPRDRASTTMRVSTSSRETFLGVVTRSLPAWRLRKSLTFREAAPEKQRVPSR